MPVFADSDAFYTVMQKMVDKLALDQAAVDSFKRAKMAVRFNCTDPQVVMILDGQHNPVRALFGAQALRADLDLSLTTDLLHDLLLGKKRIRDSFMAGQIKVSGNVFRAMQLAEPLRHVETIYPQVLQEMGYSV